MSQGITLNYILGLWVLEFLPVFNLRPTQKQDKPVEVFWQSFCTRVRFPAPPLSKIKNSTIQKRIILNNQIRADTIRVIDEKGQQIGIMSKQEALQLAKERSLDLILITDKANPPVCKLIDYGKFLYQQKKKEKKKKSSQVKGIRLRFNISPHDMKTRAKQAMEFLEDGDRVRIEMLLRGREKGLREFAKEKIDKFLEILKSYIDFEIEQELKKTPSGFYLIIKKGQHESKNKEVNSKEI